MCFYDEVQFLPTWPGIPFGDEEGKLLEGLLGQKYYSALLEHHGLIVMGRTLEETIYRAYFFERAARLQLLTMSARPIPTSSNSVAASNTIPSNKTVPVGQEILDHLPKTVPALSEAARDWRISDGPVKAHYYSWARVTIQKNKLDFMTK
jgi:hypothetical protein